MPLKGGKVFLTPIGYTLFVCPLKWVVILAPLALRVLLLLQLETMKASTAQITFWLFAALIGVSMGSIFLVYTQTSIVRVFFITAASFGALSLYGYTTQKDLSGLGSFLIMGLFGVIIASLVNLFLATRCCSSSSRWSACWCSPASPPTTRSASRASTSTGRCRAT